MKLLDSRRLTGFNLQGPTAGAVADVLFEEGDLPEVFFQAWAEALETITQRLDWPSPAPNFRRSQHTASLYFPAPLDALYAATEVNEWAIASATGNARTLAEAVEEIQAALQEEANPALIALQEAAKGHNVPMIWDDDWVSLGMGTHSQTWPSDALPAVHEVDWDAQERIPTAYVTGTNGKTTTTRMTARILQVAGKTPGSTSSDGVCVGEEQIERGDWTGTGAARMVLRHPQVDIAILETARGGMLRRGLVTESCDAALITNVSSDHLGEYGIDTVEDMARVKALVCGPIKPSGLQILNADDPHLRGLKRPGIQACWFSTNGRTEFIAEELKTGAMAWVLENNWLCFCAAETVQPVIKATEIPASYGGAAHHNIANALGAAALAQSLGATLEHIQTALRQFGSRPEDNPGRCNIQHIKGTHLLLDFGHNPKGVEAILTTSRLLMKDKGAARLWVSIGQAGDRTDEDLIQLAQAVSGAKPDCVSLREVPGYERGRQPHEVARILEKTLLEHGHSPDCIEFHGDELSSMEAALEWANPNDFIVHLVHIDREAIESLLKTHRN